MPKLTTPSNRNRNQKRRFMLPDDTPKKNFKSLFCERFNCPPSEYEEQVFRRVLYLHARLLAPLLGILTPTHFAEDFQFIGNLGGAASLIEIDAEVACHKRMYKVRSPVFLRRGLKLRVSGGKVTSLPRQLLAVTKSKSSRSK
jgi:hypothetical protein